VLAYLAFLCEQNLDGVPAKHPDDLYDIDAPTRFIVRLG
jgi:hypothetical protein